MMMVVEAATDGVVGDEGEEGEEEDEDGEEEEKDGNDVKRGGKKSFPLSSL